MKSSGGTRKLESGRSITIAPLFFVKSRPGMSDRRATSTMRAVELCAQSDYSQTFFVNDVKFSSAAPVRFVMGCDEKFRRSVDLLLADAAMARLRALSTGSPLFQKLNCH